MNVGMKSLALTALAGLVAPLPAHAAQIYGSVFEGGNGLSGQVVRVVCDSGDRDEKQTDGHGAYRLFVQRTGKCTLSLPGKGGASAAIYSFDEPVRFNFDVVGGSQLRKRQ
jgi:hypothetical protein